VFTDQLVGLIHLAGLVGLRLVRGLEVEDPQAAGRAVVGPIRQTPHLRVAALAGVAPRGVRQGGYLLKSLQSDVPLRKPEQESQHIES
jgi:hypothetical protein